MAFYGKGQNKHEYGTGSVEWKEWEPEKAPINDTKVFDGYIGRFDDPSDKAIEVKKQKPLIPSVFVHGSVPFWCSSMLDLSYTVLSCFATGNICL